MAAPDYSTMTLPSIVSVAQNLLQKGQYGAAIAPLEEVIDRTKGLTDPNKKEICQKCRFQLARSLIKTGKGKSAMPILEEYLKETPRVQERMALRMMAQSLFETKDWEQIEKVAGRLLKMSDLTLEDRLSANLMMGQALFQQEKWKECVEPLTFAANKSTDENVRQVTQIMIVRALVEAKNWSSLFSWIPRVYRTDAKYDITLNLTVMRAAKARFKQKDSPDDALNALLLYRMVLPRETLIRFAEKRIAKLSKELSDDVKVGITEYERKNRANAIDEIRKLIETLNGLPPYEDEVDFRIGQIYHQFKRYWEGYVLFDMLYGKAEGTDIGEAAILELVLTLYDLKEIDRAEKRIIQYLDAHIDGQSARTMISLMMRDNLVRQNNAKVISLRQYVDRLPPTTDEGELVIGADLHYMLAFGYFRNGDYQLAGEQFTEIITNYPNSPSLSDSYYFRGMTQMMQAKYQNAIDDFVAYQEKFEGGSFYADTKFRKAVCLFGLNKLPEAEAAFTDFIKSYPENSYVSEAYSMRGDIEAAKDGQDDPATEDIDEYDPHTLDRALDDYRKAIEKSVTPRQASYAAFQAAAVYKLEAKWQEIIDLMNYYLDLKGDQADVAEAVFWIGRAQISLDMVTEAMKAYLDAILRFGNEVDKVGVDKIIHELVTVSKHRLNAEDREGLALRLKLKLSAIDPSQKTLMLRAKIAQAMLQGDAAVAALGAEMLTTQTNLRLVPPIGLAVMCNAAVATGNTEKMGELFDYFVATYEDSEELWTAYRAKAYQLIAKGDSAGALKTVTEALEIYGADTFMGWAQMIKAQTLFKQKNYVDAYDAYNVVVNVAGWRGPLHAEAMNGMASCRKAQGKLEDAHNLYQRTYLLYKAYDDGKWAADAYLAAANCLIELGRVPDAVKTWQDMLENGYVNTLPQVDVAKKMIKKYGSAQ